MAPSTGFVTLLNPDGIFPLFQSLVVKYLTLIPTSFKTFHTKAEQSMKPSSPLAPNLYLYLSMYLIAVFEISEEIFSLEEEMFSLEEEIFSLEKEISCSLKLSNFWKNSLKPIF